MLKQIKDIAVTKTAASDSDYLVLQNPTTNETYKITKANLLAGLLNSSGIDLYYSNRLLLLHGNGANNDTNIIDSSPFYRTITRAGTIISTTQSKFGGSSLYFNGSSNYLTAPNTTNLNLGTGDFTIQAFVYLNSVTGSQYILDRYSSGTAYSWQFGLTGNKLNFYIRDASASAAALNLVGNISLSTNTWHYIAAKRVSGVLSLWANGVQDVSANANYSLDPSLILTVGKQGNTSSNYLSGYLDELRFSSRAEDVSAIPTQAFI